MTFRFRDGSVDDDTTVFEQGRVLRLISDHHIQRGPSFPKPLDLMINVPTSEATWKQMKDGKEEIKTEHMDFPDDLANGMIPLVLQGIAPRMAEIKASYLVASPKPRIVRLSIKPEGLERYRLAGVMRQAKTYNIHIELGGFAGAVAPLLGKQPHDLKIWVADGEVPTVVKTMGELYEGGPLWTMEQTSPSWPQ